MFQHDSGARALNPWGAERGLHWVSRGRAEYESRLSGENEGSTQSWYQDRNPTTQVFRGGEAKRQEWYCECSGDRYLDSGAEVEDTFRTDPRLATLVSDPGEVEGSATG